MLSSLLLLGLLAFVSWPYYTVYRLDRALMANDPRELERLVDLEAIRQRYKQKLDQDIEGVTEQYDNPVFRFLRGGVKELGSSAFDAVDYAWVRETVLNAQGDQSTQRGFLIGGFSFACFERPTRFLVRAGELDAQPVHLYLTLQNWRWQVTVMFV